MILRVKVLGCMLPCMLKELNPGCTVVKLTDHASLLVSPTAIAARISSIAIIDRGGT